MAHDLVLKGGRVIGEGYHAQFGGPHAEVNALAAAGAALETILVFNVGTPL